MKTKHINQKETALLIEEIAEYEYEKYLIDTFMYMEDDD